MQESKRFRITKRRLLPLILIAIAVALIIVMSLLKPVPPESTAQEKAWPVQTAMLDAQSRSPQLRLLGRIETPYQSTLSASVTANVDALPRLEGQTVERDDVLIELDDTEVKLLLAQREADVAELESQLTQEQNQFASDKRLLAREKQLVAIAQSGLDRENKLQASKLSSQSRTDQASQSLQAAEISMVNRQLAVANHDSRRQSLQARLARAQALLDQSRLDLERTEIRAPFTGVIVSIEVSPGERVRPGEVLATLYSTHDLEVRAQIPMQQAGFVAQSLNDGQPVTAQAQLGQSTLNLTLNRLSGQVNAGAGGIDGLFGFEDKAPAAALNRTLDLTLNLPLQPNLFAVPVSALYDEHTLYRITDGRLESIDVQLTGERFENGRQQLLIQSDTLKTGDPILTTQLPNAISGLKVTPMARNSDTEQAQ
ncbi:efflux RND transporter periplasmic adaptor subunit [Marinobacter sp. 1Y8]